MNDHKQHYVLAVYLIFKGEMEGVEQLRMSGHEANGQIEAMSMNCEYR
jgi:hypothetical protein